MQIFNRRIITVQATVYQETKSLRNNQFDYIPGAQLDSPERVGGQGYMIEQIQGH